MKTIEEVAKEFEKENGEKIWFSNDHQQGTALCIESFKAGVEFAQRWISVEEELPETNEFEESRICLIKNRYAIDIGRYYSNKKRWFLSSSNFKVTHWRYVELHNIINSFEETDVGWQKTLKTAHAEND